MFKLIHNELKKVTSCTLLAFITTKVIQAAHNIKSIMLIAQINVIRLPTEGLLHVFGNIFIVIFSHKFSGIVVMFKL